MFGTIVAIPVILVLLLLGRGIALQMMGYPVDIPPSDLAEAIASEGGDPLLCRRLQQTVPTMGPSLTEKRMLCFYLLAQKLKDPSVCELLMPSEYGWSCLGAATEKQPCLFDFAQEPEVRGNGIIALMKECLDGSADIQNNSCCIMARTVFLEENFDCALLKELPAFEDQCLRETALKRREPDTCASISNGNIRSSCEVGVRALLRK